MGTSIRIQAYKGEADNETWDNFKTAFEEEFFDAYDSGEFIEAIHSCSYSGAYLNCQAERFIREFKGSGIQLNMWYEERDPDEEMIL